MSRITQTTTQLLTLQIPKGLLSDEPSNYHIHRQGTTIVYNDESFDIQEFTTYSDLNTYMDSRISDYDINFFVDAKFNLELNSPLDTYSLTSKTGDQVSLDATCSSSEYGLAPEYQWYKNINNKDYVIPGATLSTLSTSSFTEEQAGSYKCVVSLTDTTTRLSTEKEIIFTISYEPTITIDSINSLGL